VADDLVVAVVGATGLVGREILSLLRERAFPFRDVRLLGSERTAGKELMDDGQSEVVAALTPTAFDGVDLAFFAAGPTVAAEWAPIAAGAGATVVDCSSHFRLAQDVPLVVPEVNAAAAQRIPEAIVASPSSTAVALSVALGPIAEAVGLRRVVASTYQGVAGAGQRALDALSHETMDLLNSRPPRPRRFPRRIAFNCIPQVGVLDEQNDASHELQVVAEVRKVLGLPNLPLQLTTVRVPVFFGLGCSVAVETDRPLALADARLLLRTAPGVLLHDEGTDRYLTPVEAAGDDVTHIGRLRIDATVPNGIAAWVVLDSVRKGAALNAVQIAEIVARGLI
jgi:aspartate-semialdehyde dehydrogenase